MSAYCLNCERLLYKCICGLTASEVVAEEEGKEQNDNK